MELQPRLMPVATAPGPVAPPAMAELTLQGAEPVAELKPRLLPIPKK